ncbi:MAG: outer membrane protein assembly factor BamB [Gammaproteobacteria bacterium]|nr:MAG: outer membrane protein assembly factor BamB [Gammaproteobacteria bacterium]
MTWVARVSINKLLVGAVATLLLSSCGLFSGKAKTGPEPAPLQEIEQTVAIEKLWSEDTGNGSAGQYLKLVPALGADAVFAADYNGRVSAYAQDSGKRLWRTKIKENITGATGYGGASVFVGTLKGNVYAFDADTGEQNWKTGISSEVLAPPVSNGSVVVAKSTDGKLFGLDAADGEKIWLYQRTVPTLSLRGTSAPVIFQNVVLSGFASGKLTANDLATGRILWEVSVSYPSGRSEIDRLVDVDASPLIANGILYTAAYQGQINAISLRTGRRVWTRKVSTFEDMAVDGRNLYLVDNESRVRALDMQTGEPVWTQDSLLGRKLTGPAIIGQYIAVADYKGYVHLLEPSDGKLVGRTRVGGGGALSTPVSDGERLFLLTSKGKLTALGLK